MNQTPPDPALNLPMAMPATVYVEHGRDKDDKPIFRHQVFTHWKPLPKDVEPPEIPS